MIMPNENLLTPNLGRLGVKMIGNPDLVTIWNTPYPVLRNYVKLCNKLGIKPFGGGTYKKQGHHQMGRINSGYRDTKYNKGVGGKPNSPHLFGFAIDPEFCYKSMIIKAAIEAAELFNRVILYQKTFLHLDQTNTLWHMRYSNGQRFGLCDRDGNFCWKPSIGQIIQLYKEVY